MICHNEVERREPSDGSDRTRSEQKPGGPRLGLWFGVVVLMAAGPIWAEQPRVSVQLPKAEGWAGERIPIRVELAIRGSFAGATSFDLPEVPGSLLIKIGNPVVSSREIDHQTWYVQTHEFALLSQASGSIDVPAFPVRFAQRSGFTGPVQDRQAEVPQFQVTIKRPPGTARLGFVVTTTELTIDERWSSLPEALQVGDSVTRTITQQAKAVPGMALAPLSQIAPAGVRAYLRPAELNDRTERGVFVGQRSDEITYLFQQAGRHELPELRYAWWNPQSETLETTILPALVLTIPTDHPSDSAEAPTVMSRLGLWGWVGLGGGLTVIWLGWRRPISAGIQRVLLPTRTPARLALARLKLACRNNDPQTAYTAWYQLNMLEDHRGGSSPEFQRALQELEYHLFAATPSTDWNGSRLLRALQPGPLLRSHAPTGHLPSRLPPLNPIAAKPQPRRT